MITYDKYHPGTVGPRTTLILGTRKISVFRKQYIVSYYIAHCPEKSIIPKKMGPFQFYIQDLQNYPSYPNQKEFLKSNEGNLK